MNQLSEILKDALIRKGISQSEAAQLADIERKTFNSYVNGRTEPDLITLKKIIKVLSIEEDIKSLLLEQNVPSNENKENESNGGNLQSVDYLTGKLDGKNELLAEKEARRLESERTKNEYRDMLYTNLELLKISMGTLFRHDRAYHETMLRALARLLKHRDVDALIEEADNLEFDLLEKEQQTGTEK